MNAAAPSSLDGPVATVYVSSTPVGMVPATTAAIIGGVLGATIFILTTLSISLCLEVKRLGRKRKEEARASLASMQGLSIGQAAVAGFVSLHGESTLPDTRVSRT